MDLIFNFQKLKEKLSFRTMFLALCFVLTSTQWSYAETNKTVSGVVKDQSGQVLPGVNISVVGTQTGAISNFDGTYQIIVPEKAKLAFSFIGYIKSEVEVGEKSVVDVVLLEDSKNIDEVVVIGYGETKKKDLAMAVSTFGDVDKMKSRPVTNINEMMQGNIAGVVVANNGGDPLSSQSVVIRGKGSTGGDNLLYVVDGVPGAPFNPEDVESINILKDAASAAIYGAQVGSGGVIIVSTKKAVAGKAKISVNVSNGIASVWNKPEALTMEQYIKVKTDAYSYESKQAPSVINATNYPYGQKTTTDWVDEIFRLAKTQHYAISLTGGTDDIKGFASVEYDAKEGTLINTFSKSLGAKVKVDFKVNDYINFSQTANYSYSNGQGDVNTTSHTGVILASIQMPRSATVYEVDDNGNYILGLTGKRQFGGTVPQRYSSLGIAGDYGEVVNPVATLSRLDQDRPSNTIFSASTLSIKPIPELTLKSTFSGSKNFKTTKIFSPMVAEIGKTNLTNSLDLTNENSTNWLWESTLSFSKLLMKDHSVSAMIGSSVGGNEYNYLNNYTKTFANELDNLRYLGNGASFYRPIEYKEESSFYSFLGRVGYSYADRYFFNASIRRDATSKLYKDNRFGNFPSVSGAWKVSSEPFFKSFVNSDLVSLLKVRASWGQIGNVNAVPTYSSYKKYRIERDLITSGTAYPLYNLDFSPNNDLKWETSEQLDLGLDVNLFNDKLSIVIDYFNKETKDLIENVQDINVPTAVVPTNIGSVRNRGLEFSAEYKNNFKDLSYSIGANITYLKNEVLNISMDNDRDYLAHSDNIRSFSPFRSTKGEALYSYYVIKSNGIFQSDDEAKNYKSSNGTVIQPNAKAGDLKFIDKDDNGKIDDNDKQYSGSYSPKYTYGINGSLAWKGFDFYFQIQGIYGNKIFNAYKAMTVSGDQGWNMTTDVLDSWNYNKTSGVPRLYAGSDDSNGNYSTTSDYFLEDGSYLRLKNLTLGYSLPKNVLNKIKLTKVRFYLSGENLVTFTDYKGLDPEVGNNGLDGGKYPISRIFSFGINIGL